MTHTRRFWALAGALGLAWVGACNSSSGGVDNSCAVLTICCAGAADSALCNGVVQADDPDTCTQAQATFCVSMGGGSGSGAGFGGGDGGSSGSPGDGSTHVGAGSGGSTGFDDAGGGGGGGDDDGRGSGFDDAGGSGDEGGGVGDDAGGSGSCVAPGGTCSDKNDCCDALTSCTNNTCACGTAGYECIDISCCPGFDCASADNGTDMACQAQGCQEVGGACTTVDDCCADAFLCSEAPDGGVGDVCWGTQ